MYLLSATSATVELELRVRARQLQDMCVVSVCVSVVSVL